jgi:hypothetical protein
MCKFLRFLLPLIFVAVATANLNAGLVTFDLTTSGIAGSALDAMSDGTTYLDVGTGVTISASTTTSLDGATGSRLNAVGDGAGVDTLSVTGANGDGASEIDSEETLKFTFTFSSATSIDLVSIDLQGQFGNATQGDQAFVDVADTSTDLFVGAPNYNGNLQVWTPTGVSITSGQTITFSGEDDFRVQSITFNVPEQTAVPEPSSLLMFGTALVSILMPRKRRR